MSKLYIIVSTDEKGNEQYVSTCQTERALTEKLSPYLTVKVEGDKIIPSLTKQFSIRAMELASGVVGAGGVNIEKVASQTTFGKEYDVVIEHKKPVSCTCDSFKYRGKACNHMDRVTRRIKEGRLQQAVL